MTSFVIENELLLSADPVTPGQAASKQYLDGLLTSIPSTKLTGVSVIGTGRLPALTGKFVANAGAAVLNIPDTAFGAGTFLKATVDADGVITGVSGSLLTTDLPSDLSYNKIVGGKPTTISGYGLLDAVSLGGDTMTGTLSSTVGSFSDSDLVTKGYVDNTRSALYLPSVHETGDIMYRGTAGAVNGYFRCNGAVLSKASYASLFAVVGDNYSYTPLPGAGQPWKRQYEFNKATNGDLTWGAAGSLPDVLGASSVVVTKNRIYLIGGYNSNIDYVTTSYTAPINADGTIGTWTTTTAAPMAVYMSQVIAIKNKLYMIGGFGSAGAVTGVYSTLISPTGTLGSWVAQPSLPVGMSRTQAVVTKNRIHLLGGVDSVTGYTANCYTAPIDSNGVIGTWSLSSTPLAGPLGSSHAVVTKNRVYLIGGYTGTAWATNAQTAVINPDGTLGAWTFDIAIPYQTYESIAVIGNRVYRIGAWNGSTVSYMTINADGTLSAGGTCSPLPNKVCYSQTAVTGGKIYLLSGFDGATWSPSCYAASFSGGLNDYSSYYEAEHTPGGGNPSRLQNDFNYNEATDIKNWANGTPLPDVVVGGNIIVTKNKVHIIGGYNAIATYRLNTYTADIDANGAVGAWSISQTLPVSMAHGHPLVVKNKVYIIGGIIGGAISSSIYCANINSDGSLGTWTSVGSLPSISTAATLVATKNRVYLISGYNTGTATTTNTYSAIINDDGTLGTWYAGYSTPVGVGYGQAVVTSGYVYLFGGFTAPAGTPSGVHYAPIQSDGTLGPWVTGTPIGVNISYHMSFSTKSRVFVLGGITGSYSAAVYSAPIQSDGMLGAWTRGTDLPYTTSQGHLFLTGSRLYVLGGRQDGAYSANVYYAPFVGGMNDYSSLYSGVTTVTSSAEFRIPDLSSAEKSGKYYYIKY